MEVSTLIFFSLVLCGVKDVKADASLAELDTRVGQVERDIEAWKLTTGDTQIRMIKDFKRFESSLKEELTGTFVPTLIRRLVNQAITDILTEKYIGNIITRRVLVEVESYREGLQELQLKLPTDIQSLNTQLNQTNDDLSDTRYTVSGLTEDLMTLNTSCVMTRKEVESYREDLQKMQLKLPRDIQSLNTQLNQTNDDLSDTRYKLSGLTEDLMTLNTSCCGTRKEVESYRQDLVTLNTSCCGTRNEIPTTTAPTDPIPSSTVPPAPVTTQDSDLHASTDPSPSTTVPPAPVTTLDSDLHATPSPAADRDLYSASDDGDLERVKRILSAGHVDINSRRYTRTPVMMAAWRGHRHVVEFLVGRGADVSLVDSDGDNILHLACYGGDLETVKLILSLNVVDINSRGVYSKTPVMAAADNGQRDVVEFLVGRGANVSLVSSGGNNILHLACWSGDLETVKLILSLNVVDINARNKYGETAADMARVFGHQQVAVLLVSRGGH